MRAPEFDTSDRQRGRREGANTVAVAVLLGTLPLGLVPLFGFDGEATTFLAVGWVWLVAAAAGAYVNFTRPK